MLKKSLPIVPPPQAFTATTTRTPNSTESLSQDPCKALNQLASQLGFNPQPTTQQPQAFFTSHSQNNQIRGRTTKNHGRGRARFSSNRATIEQFNWASNQNKVYESCDSCDIGHIPSDCANRDPIPCEPDNNPLLIMLIIVLKHHHGYLTLALTAM